MNNIEVSHIVYSNYVNDFINVIDKDIKMFTFEQLYRSVYIMSVLHKHEMIHLLFEKGKHKIIDLDYEKQQKCYKLLYGVFMYPIRIGIIKNHKCMLCDDNISYTKLYCDSHTKKMDHMNDIHKFKSFKNDHLVGGHIYEKFMEC